MIGNLEEILNDNKIPSPSVVDVQKLVLSYLVYECYSETAQLFRKATGISDDMELDSNPSTPENKDKTHKQDIFDMSNPAWTSIQRRKELQNLVLGGNIDGAIALVFQAYPMVLLNHPHGPMPATVEEIGKDRISFIYFDLLCQKYIEMVKQQKIKEALEYAQFVLGPLAQGKPALLEKLPDIIAIIAYEDPWSSPVASYLSDERKFELSNKLNHCILVSLGCQNIDPLGSIVRQLTSVQLNNSNDQILNSWSLSTWLGNSKTPV